MSTPIATIVPELVADETLALKSLASTVGTAKSDPSQYEHFDQNAVDGLQNLSEQQTLNMIAVTEEGKTTPNGKFRKKKLVYFDSPYKKGEVGAALPMSLTPMGTLSDPCTNKIPDFRWTDLLKILKKKGEPVNVQKLMNGNVFRKWRAQGLYIDTIKNLCVELESVGFFKRVQGDSSRNPYWVTGSEFKWDLQAYMSSIQSSYDGKEEIEEGNPSVEPTETQPVEVGDSQQPSQAVTDTFSPRPKRLSEDATPISRPKKRRRQATDAEIITKMRDKDNVLKYCVRIRGDEFWMDVSEICDHKDAGSLFDKVKEFEIKQVGDDLKAVDSIEDRVVANTYNKTLNFVVKWQNGETTLEPYSKVAALPAVHTLLFNEIANLREEVELLKQKNATNELEIQHKDQMLQQIAQSVSQTTLMEGQVKP